MHANLRPRWRRRTRRMLGAPSSHTPRATFLSPRQPFSPTPLSLTQPSRPITEAGRLKVLNCEKAIEEKFETCIDQVEHSERNPSDFTIYSSAACLWLVIFGFVLIIFHNF